MRKELEIVEPVLSAIRDRLEHKRKETFEALRNYPRQVAGCDTHYQYLAEQRAKISGELREFDALRVEDDTDGIDAFIRRSSFIDDETARTFRAELYR